MSVAETEVTRANWREPPHSRWAFQNLRAVLPVADIPNDPADVTPLPETPTSFDGFELNLPGGRTLNLEGFLQATASDGLVVLKEGHLVFETYANGLTPHAPHIFMSASKAMTGLIAGILQQQGDLNLDAQVSAYVPELAGSGYAGATLRNLIDMRAGVLLDPAQTEIYSATCSAEPDAPDFKTLIQDLSAPRAHGGLFSYVSINTDLVGWAMERATGRPFADLVSDLLWRPMGAGDAAYISTDRSGAAWCSGGFCASVRDLARIGDLLVNNGRRGDVQIVPKAWIDDLCDNGDRAAWRDGEWGKAFAFLGPEISYRAGWYSLHAAPKTLFAMGTHGQNLFVDRANRIVIAKLSSQGPRIDGQAIGLTHMAADEIRRLLLRGD